MPLFIDAADGREGIDPMEVIEYSTDENNFFNDGLPKKFEYYINKNTKAELKPVVRGV